MKIRSNEINGPSKNSPKTGSNRPSERQFVESLRGKALRHLSRNPGTFHLAQGIGDDCAVISAKRGQARGGELPMDLPRDLLVTTDLFVEGIHFRGEWQPAVSVGYKVLVRGLSDIAAMGGLPRFAFLSLGLPRGIDWRWVDEFFKGFFRLAASTGVVLAGGDTGASRSGVLAEIMLMGEVPRGTAVLRSGARPGDSIWVSGRLGAAARALDLLRHPSRPSTDAQGHGRKPNDDRKRAGRRQPHLEAGVLRPLFYPKPRLEIGQHLRERGLSSAMMDLSDGLSIDLARLCKASGVGARIDESSIPRHESATLEMALHGGEDFELLFTVPRAKSSEVPKRLGITPLTRIGEITQRKALRLVREKRERALPIRGFEHF